LTAIDPMQEKPRNRLLVYGIALLVPAITLMIRWPLRPILADRVLYMAFIPAIMIAAYLGGLGPGLVATVLSTLATLYYLVAPLHFFRIADDVTNGIGVVLLLMVGTMISALCESLQRTQRRMLENERHRSQEVLRRTEGRLELAVRGSDISIVELNMPDSVLEHGQWDLVNVGQNTTSRNPTEWPIDFATGMARVHPDDRERMGRAIRDYLSGKTGEFETECRIRDKGDFYSWTLARGVAVRDEQGRAIRLTISSVDITELKRAESELRISEQRFRTFVDHATDAFFLFDDRNVVLDVNRQACERLGYRREELVGLTAIDFDPDVTPAQLEEMQRKLDDKQIIAFESRHRRKDGTIFPVEISGQAFSEAPHGGVGAGHYRAETGRGGDAPAGGTSASVL
jgi:PAS domain S-box-containing protein